MSSKDHNHKSKVSQVLNQLTLEEKIHLIHGDMMSGGIPRLNIPQLICADGPVGIRLKSPFYPGGALPGGAINLPGETVPGADESDPAAGGTTLGAGGLPGVGDGEVQNDNLAQAEFTPTAFSSTLGLAATFDTDLAASFGRTIALEAKAANIRVMFGPGVNLMRDPRCGRNFEYFGEDPYLTAAVATAYIKAMQAEGVSACAKHYYANDLEFRRHFTSSNLNPRTAWETHLPPFIAACKDANVWTIMTGNNLVNGTHISENADQLKGILRNRLDWDGVILTDWRAAYTPEGSITGGTTMTTGFCQYVFGDGRLLEAVREGKVSPEEIDNRVHDVLTLYARTGLLDPSTDPPPKLDTAEHRDKARLFARDSMVLLKNTDEILPLSPSEVRKLIVTGPAADTIEMGSGSSKVAMDESAVTPLAGLIAAYENAEVIHQPDIHLASSAASDADAVLYFAVGPSCGEGFDLESTTLPDHQADEIATLAQTCGQRLVVILQCGTAVDNSRWADRPAAILIAWFAGQMLGSALSDILTGAVSPSGKLPCTFGNPIDDYPCARLGLWPAKLLLDEEPPKPGFKPEERFVLHAYDADYCEGVYLGYRWFQRENIKPVYPFGFGLSYTRFEFSDLQVNSADDGKTYDVTCTVHNTGQRQGAEVIQVYIQPPFGSSSTPAPGTPGSSAHPVDRPLRELKGFAKVMLNPGESKRVTVNLPVRALTYYDAQSQRFKADQGEYRVQVATSCENVLLQQIIVLTRDIYAEV